MPVLCNTYALQHLCLKAWIEQQIASLQEVRATHGVAAQEGWINLERQQDLLRRVDPEADAGVRDTLRVTLIPLTER